LSLGAVDNQSDCELLKIVEKNPITRSQQYKEAVEELMSHGKTEKRKAADSSE